MAAPDGRTSKTACPHGLFGSCKSLFTAAPHALPHGDERARARRRSARSSRWWSSARGDGAGDRHARALHAVHRTPVRGLATREQAKPYIAAHRVQGHSALYVAVTGHHRRNAAPARSRRPGHPYTQLLLASAPGRTRTPTPSAGGAGKWIRRRREAPAAGPPRPRPAAHARAAGGADERVQRSPAKRSFSGTGAPVVSWTRTKVSMPMNSPNLSLPILRKKMFSP